MPGAKNSNTNLLSRILSIFNNTLNAYGPYQQAHFKDIAYTTMTVCFFRDRTLHEQYDTCDDHDSSPKEKETKIRKEKDRLRKIDSIQANHVCAFLKNFFSKEEETDLWIALLDAHFQSNRQKGPVVDDIVYDSKLLAQICNNINSLYHEINPYPWYKFESCQTGYENYDADYEITSTMAKQLLFLFIHEVFNHKTDAAFLPYNIFEEKYCTRLAVSGSVDPYFGEYLDLHKPLGIRNSHLLSKPIHDYDSLLSDIRPDYVYWQKICGEIKLQDLNPFVLSPEETIKRILAADDLLIITEPLHGEVMDLLNNLPCKIMYLNGTHLSITDDRIIQITAQEFLDDIIKSFISDKNETDLLIKLADKIGYDTEIYKLLDKYYKKYEKATPGRGLSFLEKLTETQQLYDVEETLNTFDHLKVTSPLSASGKKSGIFLRNAILNVYNKSLGTEDKVMLRILCRLQEIDSSLSCKQICHIWGRDSLYHKLLLFGWINDSNYHIPELIVSSVSYKPNLSNKELTFYFDTILLEFSEILFGHRRYAVDLKIYTSIIDCLHEQNKQYLFRKSKKSLDIVEKEYYNKFHNGKLAASQEIDSALSFRKNGTIQGHSKMKEDDPFTDIIFQHETVIKNFYNSALIFCYEYEQFDLASEIYHDIYTDDSFAFHKIYKMNKENIESLSGSRIWKKILFAQDLTVDFFTAEFIYIVENDKYLDVLKPLLLIFLRYSLCMIVKKLALCLTPSSSAIDVSPFKDAVLTATKFLENFKKYKINAEDLYPSEKVSIYLYAQLLLCLCGETPEKIEVTSINTFYQMHQILVQKVIDHTTNTKSDFSSESLGDLPPFAEQLLSLLK